MSLTSRVFPRAIIASFIMFILLGCGSSNSGDGSNISDGGSNIPIRDSGAVLPSPSGSVPYDLYGTDAQNRGAIPFAVNWPIEPTTTQTLYVPGGVSLSTALATSGATIYVAAGSYGNLGIFQNDQHWILDNGATFSNFEVTGDRIIVEGGNVSGAGVFAEVFGCTDVLIKNVNFNVQEMATGLGGLTVARVAWVQNTITATEYGMYVSEGSRSVGGDDGASTDLIMVGNHTIGGTASSQSTNRIQAVNRGIFIDNRTSNEAGNWVWRFHHGEGPIWFRNNLIDEGSFGMNMYPDSGQGAPDSADIFDDFWFYDSDFYINGGGPYVQRQAGPGASMDEYWGVLTAKGNNGYGGNWAWNVQPKDDVSNNTDNSSLSPPALGAWLVVGGVPPGADH